MGEFLSILAAYYLCDATAALRPMSHAEAAECIATYDRVKTYFVADFDLAPAGTVARFSQMSDAYLAFQSWEAANPDLVADMRAEAWAEARGLSPSAL
jgi:hypothetical protein